jgi:PAS domain S-box-containing protein
MVSLSEVETGRFYDVNAEFVRVSGLPRKELIGRTSTEIGWITLEERARVAEALRESPRESPRVQGLELRQHDRAGREVMTLFFGEIVPVNGVPYLLSISQEINERKRLEEAQRESEARFRAVVENSHDSILFADARGRVIYRSPSSGPITGYANDQRLGHDAFATVHPDDVPRLRTKWAFMLEEPDSV